MPAAWYIRSGITFYIQLISKPNNQLPERVSSQHALLLISKRF
jgi:hypothetical protein